jgi:hypothetical protein
MTYDESVMFQPTGGMIVMQQGVLVWPTVQELLC